MHIVGCLVHKCHNKHTKTSVRYETGKPGFKTIFTINKIHLFCKHGDKRKMYILCGFFFKIVFSLFCVLSFHAYGDVTITSEGLKMFIHVRHTCFSSRESLACHTYLDTGHTLKCSSARIHNNHTCCRAFGRRAVATWGLSSVATRDQTPKFRMRCERSFSQAKCGGFVSD